MSDFDRAKHVCDLWDCGVFDGKRVPYSCGAFDKKAFLSEKRINEGKYSVVCRWTETGAALFAA